MLSSCCLLCCGAEFKVFIEVACIEVGDGDVLLGAGDRDRCTVGGIIGMPGTCYPLAHEVVCGASSR